MTTVSCLGFMSPAQRAALAASSRDDGGAPLSAFASPPASAGKTRRVRLLAGSPDPAVRESAALSARAPVEVLTRLAGDESPSVRCCVARNPRTPPALLVRLAADPDPRVRAWVAAHRRTPPEVGRRLAKDPDPSVRALHAWSLGWRR